jgi:uncharacterized protein (TIGR02466 family)
MDNDVSAEIYSDRVNPLFPSFLFSRQFDQIDELNKGLMRVLREVCQPTGGRHSGQGGLRSKENLFYNASPEIQTLKRMIAGAFDAGLKHMIPGADRYPPAALGFSLIGWAYILREGDYVSPHVHPEATIVGTYYVRCPGAARKPAEGLPPGGLVLMNPAPATPMMNHSGLAFPTVEPVVPREGLLVMFPSHIPHYVHPFRGNGERIAVSFDFIHSPGPRGP